MKYALVVSGKSQAGKSPTGWAVPYKAFAIERLRNEADVEKRMRAVRAAGGQVIAVGFDSDPRFEQRAKLAVLQLTNGSWDLARARAYLQEYLRDHCRDEYVLELNRRLELPPS